MIKYVFSDLAAIPNAKAAVPQKIGEELAAISALSGGRLTAGAVVEAARNPKSALHPHFEWDDAVAAEAYRLDQARAIIRVVRVEGEDEPARAFLSVGDADGISYRASEEVKGSLDLQLAVLRQAERDLQAFERRYRDLQDICDGVTVSREKVSARRAEMEARA